MNGTDLESDRTLLSGLMILITMVTGNVIDMLNFYPRKIFVRNIVSNKMKDKNYHTVGTVLNYHTVGTALKSNKKTKTSTLSEQF